MKRKLLCFLAFTVLGFFLYAEKTTVILEDSSKKIFFIADKDVLLLQNDGQLKKVSNFKIKKLEILGFEKTRFILIAAPKTLSDEAYFAFYTGKTIGIFQINKNEIQELFSLKQDNTVQSLAVYSKDLLCALDKGLAQVVLQGKYLNDQFKLTFLTHNAPVYSLDFSRNAAYILTASSDGKVKLWRKKDFSCIAEFQAYYKKNLDVLFSPTSDSFVYATKSNDLQLRNIAGTSITIKLNSEARLFRFTSDGKFLAVLTSDKKIYFYESKSGKPYATIKVDQEKDIIDMQFSPDKKTLALLYEKNIDFLNFLSEMEKEAESPKNEKHIKSDKAPIADSSLIRKNTATENADDSLPSLPKTSENEYSKKEKVSKTNEAASVSSEKAEQSSEKTNEQKNNFAKKLDRLEKRVDKIEDSIEASIEKTASGESPHKESSEGSDAEESKRSKKTRKKTGQSEAEDAATSKETSTSIEPIEDTIKEVKSFTNKALSDAVEIAVSFQPYVKNKYYVGTLVSSLGYFFNKWTAPFYFGIDLALGVGFPTKKFPFDYYLGEKKLHSPYALELSVSLPLGLYFAPFNNDLIFRSELNAGLLLRRLWNGSTKAAIYTKFHPSAKVDFKFLVQWRFIAGEVGVHYDTGFKFAVTAGIKCIIPINYKKGGSK